VIVHPTCECCETRPAVGAVAVPDDVALLCGTCLDDAQALGLIVLVAVPLPAGR
jgi:hypothetical protein